MHRVQISISFLLLFGLQVSSGLKCYVCEWDSHDATTPGGCRDNAELIDDSFSQECEEDQDVCFFSYAEYDDGDHKVYRRDCGVSLNYDGNLDKCQRCEGFYDELDECVCSTDNCNTGNTFYLSTGIFSLAIVSLSSVM